MATAVTIAIPPSHATTLVPLSFEQLVERAETIFEGEVVDQRAEARATADGDAIVTMVTFRVTRALKGNPAALVLLEFLGGTLGDRTLHIIGMPQFDIGDRDVLFVRERGLPVSPIVGFAYGRFRITVDRRTGEEVVLMYDQRPLASTVSIGQPPVVVSPQAIRPLSLRSFEDSIVQRVQERAR